MLNGFGKAAALPRDSGVDGLASNPWQLEFPDRGQVGDIVYYSQPRRWLRVDHKGVPTYETIDRQDLVHQLNISYRDVRILDPLVATPYPTALLIREKALIVNMEAVRMIICPHQCYVLSVPNSNSPGRTGVFPASENTFVKDLIGLIRKDHPQMLSYSQAASMYDESLPYELRALEAALQATTRTLTLEVEEMESRTEPCLRALLQLVTEKQLEQLRILKTSLKNLSDRVGKVRTELEDTLDDDQDMLDMYLGRRAEQDALDNKEAQTYSQINQTDASSMPSLQHDKGAGEGEHLHPLAEGASSRDTASSSSRLQHHQPRSATHHLSALLARLAEMKSTGNLTDETLSMTDVAAAGLYAMAHDSQPKAHSPPDPRDISECEGLLEVYYKQMDELSSRLAATRTQIADSEASIEVLLDQRRNGLTALTLVVNSVMLGFAFVSAVVGGFGMNFATWMSDETAHQSQRYFWMTLGLASGVGLTLFLGVMVYARFKRLLFTPDVQMF